MTDQEATATDLGELVVSVAGFLRSAVPNQVGLTTVQLIAGTPEWERLLQAAAKVADQ